MRIILIGKTGSDTTALRMSLNVSGIDCQQMSPIDALAYKSEDPSVMILYIKTSFMNHWHCTMQGDYWSENRRKLFNDEIMDFRDADDIADEIIVYDGTSFFDLDMEVKGWIAENSE